MTRATEKLLLTASRRSEFVGLLEASSASDLAAQAV